uniref:Uncharacterized protein n=1 Tax=Setaria italica TaxID=4555 RepID=K3ZKN9_SETIT
MSTSQYGNWIGKVSFSSDLVPDPKMPGPGQTRKKLQQQPLPAPFRVPPSLLYCYGIWHHSSHMDIGVVQCRLHATKEKQD